VIHQPHNVDAPVPLDFVLCAARALGDRADLDRCGAVIEGDAMIGGVSLVLRATSWPSIGASVMSARPSPDHQDDSSQHQQRGHRPSVRPPTRSTCIAADAD
jgi:hypothetical protein